MPSQWFYASNGGQAGPVDTAELRRLAGAGALQPTDLVWREGLPEWVPATKVKGLFATAAPADGSEDQPPEQHEPSYAAAPDPGYPMAAPAPAPAAGYAPQGGMLAYEGGGSVAESVSPRAIELLRQTRPWVLLFSVLMFIFAGIAFLGGLLMAGLGLVGGRGTMAFAALVGVLYILFGLLYFFPALYLGRYASRIGALATTRRADTLESALEAQKSFWKFLGVATLVVIGLYVLVFVIAVVIGATTGSRM